MKINDFENWNDFFDKKLEKSNLYKKQEFKKKGDTLIVRFIPVSTNDKTEIIIGFLDETLIYWKFENPLTVGFSEQQKREYFYRYDFTPNKSYGNPGLEFNKYNIEAIESQLENGLSGIEVQYYRNGNLIKSRIVVDEPNEYSTTINFEKKNFWKDIFNLKKGELIEKRIELSSIFNGLKNKKNVS